MEAGNIQHLQPIAERNAREEAPAAFIRISRVKEISGLSKSTLLRWIKARKFPAPVLIEKNKEGPKLKAGTANAVCLWDLAEVMQWRSDQFKKREQRIEAEAAQPEAGA